MDTELTPCDKFSNWWAKRDDLACWSGMDYPSGSKVRQYEHMARKYPKLPMLVGCGSYSAMQVYVSAAAKQSRVPGIIFTAERAKRTDATNYALRMGAAVHYVRPGYMNVVRARAKEHGKSLGAYVKWDVLWALKDACAQVSNIPSGVKRIIVPTGSGLTCAGVLGGLAELGRSDVSVLAVAVSGMCEASSVLELTKKLSVKRLPQLSIVRHPSSYGSWLIRSLPDGTPLDPFYSAKSMDYVEDGDCLWLPGLRPVCAMPAKCQKAFADWRGFAR